MSKLSKKQKVLQIAGMLEDGISQNLIAGQMHISKSDVSLVNRLMKQKNLTSLLIMGKADEEVNHLFTRAEAKPDKQESMYAMPDLDYYCNELLKPGVTKALLHEEYVEQCKKEGKIPYQLTQFKVYLSERLKKKEFSEIINHKPGEETEVDWTGDPARWADPDTGEILEGYLFVGVLSFSGLAYAEVFEDMTLPNWILAHKNMYEYFGGCTRVLICDNLKTGVIRHPKNGNVVLQADYKAMADHYGTLILPAKPVTPKEKPLTENTVGKLETYILARMRNIQCMSIDEYNGYVRELVDQSNCCISHQKCYYSVPYKYIGETVDVRIYAERLEIYSGMEKLCEHRLVKGKIGVYVLEDSHFPPNSSRYGSWNSTCFRSWAKDYGPYTYEVIDRMFQHGAEQKYYNSARSLLKLADVYSVERVERACQLALKHYMRPVYRNIKAILETGQDLNENTVRLNDQRKESQEKVHLRGAEYYAKKK